MKFIIKDEIENEEKRAYVSLLRAGDEVNIYVNDELVAYFTTHSKGKDSFKVWADTLEDKFDIDVDVMNKS